MKKLATLAATSILLLSTAVALAGKPDNTPNNGKSHNKVTGQIWMDNPDQQMIFNAHDYGVNSGDDKGEVEYWNYEYGVGVLHYSAEVVCASVEEDEARFMFQIPEGWPISELYVVSKVYDDGTPGIGGDKYWHTSSWDYVTAYNWCESGFPGSEYPVVDGNLVIHYSINVQEPEVIVLSSGGSNSCTTIQDGLITYGRVGDPSADIIPIGYDEWGYNYQAHMFNGMWCDYHPYYRAGGGGYNWCLENMSDVELMMKWSDEWLSNKNCNQDTKLDRGYTCDPTLAKNSGCPGAWLTNHERGSYDEDSVVDTVNIGVLTSEDGHNLEGWSDVWDWGGGYGGGDDGTLRLLMGPGDGCGEGYENASFTLNTNGAVADKLYLRHLDGSQDDNFDVLLWNGQDYEIIGSYESQGGGENWVTSEFGFTPQSGELMFKLVATGEVTGWCSNWGQVAFSWAEIEGTCYYNYFVKIVAAPEDAYVENGYWYSEDGVEIGEVIWGAFAITQEVSNDSCTGEKGLLYKSPLSPGLGYYTPKP